MLEVVRMGKAALVYANMRGLRKLHFLPFTVNYRENSAIKAATLESVEFSFLECFLFFFLWTWNNELENIAHSVLSFYFQLTKCCIQNTGTMRLAVTNKIKNKSRKPHSDHATPRGRCRLVPWTSSGLSSGFAPPPAEVRMESHDQLVVILSYFE